MARTKLSVFRLAPASRDEGVHDHEADGREGVGSLSNRVLYLLAQKRIRLLGRVGP